MPVRKRIESCTASPCSAGPQDLHGGDDEGGHRRHREVLEVRSVLQAVVGTVVSALWLQVHDADVGRPGASATAVERPRLRRRTYLPSMICWTRV